MFGPAFKVCVRVCEKKRWCVHVRVSVCMCARRVCVCSCVYVYAHKYATVADARHLVRART